MSGYAEVFLTQCLLFLCLLNFKSIFLHFLYTTFLLLNEHFHYEPGTEMKNNIRVPLTGLLSLNGSKRIGDKMSPTSSEFISAPSHCASVEE